MKRLAKRRRERRRDDERARVPRSTHALRLAHGARRTLSRKAAATRPAVTARLLRSREGDLRREWTGSRARKCARQQRERAEVGVESHALVPPNAKRL